MRYQFLCGVIGAVLIAAFLVPVPAGAISNDKLTYLTFSRSVQIPGATLTAGTYRFRLTNLESGRNILQVLSNDGGIVYAMFHTIPDSRVTVTKEAVVTFKETPAGVPPAVRSLFYGGEYRGYEFVYPKGWMMVPPDMPQPEITFTAAPPVVAVPVPEAQAVPAAAPAPEAAPTAPVELPKTASPLPFLAIGGLTSLVAGVGLGLVRRRTH
jgi:LPXTG-motif cell wall-anchored protein